MNTILLNSTESDISKAANLLMEGELVGIPTETVYGLAADASNVSAINKIFEVKGRPKNHPLILHLSGIEKLNEWAIDIPNSIEILSKNFWPGPMSVLLKKHPNVLKEITGGSNKICIRIPNHSVTLSLLKKLKNPIVAPSANLFGRVSPTSAQHVFDDLNGKIAAILDGGQCQVGLESTIIDLTEYQPRILRPGEITIEKFEKILDRKISHDFKSNEKVSGNLVNHYQPIAAVYAYKKSEIEKIQIDLSKKRSVFLAFSEINKISIPIHKMPNEAKKYAQVFYSTLRLMDENKFENIFIELPPEEEEWYAVHDRIKKASFKK